MQSSFPCNNGHTIKLPKNYKNTQNNYDIFHFLLHQCIKNTRIG